MSKLLIANWKSHKTHAGLLSWWDEFMRDFQLKEGNLLAIAAPFTLLGELKKIIEPIENIKLAAQTVSPFPMGSYTGEINAQQLSELGVKYVIVGHSERRRYFHETDELVADQVREVLAAGMTPVLCVDEGYIESQAQALDDDALAHCVIAYEPLAAIGSGVAADVGSVAAVVKTIRSVYGSQVPVLYGGSVTPENVGEYVLVCDGALVGGASLDGATAAQICSALVA